MRTFFRNEDGVGAIEFALLASMLSMILLGICSGWSYTQQDSHMRDSIEAAAKYYIQGGTNDSTALAIAEAAWSNKPANGNVNIDRCQICPNQTGCIVGLNCADASVPQIHLTIMATSTWSDPFKSSLFPNGLTLAHSEVIRVR